MMGTIHPIFEHKPFDPAVCDAMGLAFDGAWQKLLVAGTALAAPGYADTTREASPRDAHHRFGQDWRERRDPPS
jgi:hypothetical protein